MFKIINSNKYDNMVNNVLYYAFFVHQLLFLFSVSDFVRENNTIHKIVNAMIIISFFVIVLVCLYYFLRFTMSRIEFIIYILLAIPLLISLYNYRVVMVISNLFYVFAFKNADSKKGMRYALYATVIGFIINVLIGIFTRYTGDCVQVRYGVERVRCGMGFYYATIGSFYFLTILLIFILVKELKWYHYISFLILSIIIFILTDTKAPLAYEILTLLLYFLIVQNKIFIIDKLFDIITIVSFPLATILTLFLSYTYNPNNIFYIIMNKILTGRLLLTYNALNKCGWTIFGQNPGIWGDGYYIDSSIVSMLVQNGLLILILSVAFITFYSYIAVKTKNKPLMIVLCIIALRSTFDFGFMTMQLCPAIIMFYTVLGQYIKQKNINI